MAFSGKFEYGMDTSGAPSSRKMKTPRLVGSIESGMDVISQSKRCGLARARRRYVKTVSVLLVVCAVAIVIVSAIALVPLGKTTASQIISAKDRAPGPPHTIFGYTYDIDGTTPLLGCDVLITVLATGEQYLTTSSSDEGIYSIDMTVFILGYAWDDMLNVTAQKGAFAGWNESAVTDNVNGYNQIDVTLDTLIILIPEFPMVIVPVAGMIALVAVVGLRRRGEEQ
ncbi:MAG: hypothetical protein KJ653_05240 [Candidatus Thermoplasmatota archaeon]|nr:hypothetical protein [Candidatus Thermoplasmatota archaeon]